MQYIKYLQTLLDQHHLKYQSEEQFKQQLKYPIQSEIKKNGPLSTNISPLLSGELINRYSRQMLLKEVQYQGQLKIIKSKVAVIGAGGIGCPLSIYLASAGLSTIGLFDSDKVQITNLHRQIGHKTSTIGLQKTQSLKNSLLSINPTISVLEHPAISIQTLNLLDNYEIIIDGSDNPLCRYLVNDYCMKKGKKLLSGACIGWQGQITCYGGIGPCYRCIWGDEQVSFGGCSTLGVLGMVPGLVGQILAIQCIKLILQNKSSLEGQLLTFDARNMCFRKLKLRKPKPQCLGCGVNKLDIQKYEYSKYTQCGTNLVIPEVPTVTWSQFIEMKQKEQVDPVIIDVRGEQQYGIINFSESKNIPYEKLKQMPNEDLKALGKDKTIGVSCKRGIMSKLATSYLLTHGIKAINIQGGIDQYGQKYDQNIVSL